MTKAVVVPDVGMEFRWRDWQARGAALDRRRAATMRRWALIVGAALAAWVVVQLA